MATSSVEQPNSGGRAPHRGSQLAHRLRLLPGGTGPPARRL